MLSGWHIGGHIENDLRETSIDKNHCLKEDQITSGLCENARILKFPGSFDAE
jgi:hypothetical protein